ncbi:chemotaxis protein CheA [Candidatus Photodesmus anomalopis]|uniref:Chemotaxis protein CheA n=1 Tax=Candidatus Photodesmus katoptron Akat1 TaxID=1236703 RepID=S3EHP2_9GAMM|nr:chemotaxis protein CheA [Candidatus Photodesmus katoptron]EPE37703.1 CheA [Candidatus Photodesmus katoptron Akat1]
MAYDLDENILQDFLIEASEILEQLSQELIELEKKPDDDELLNSIFRNFHTLKGGASFLSLTEFVDLCHRAENIFDSLRNRKYLVSSSVIDAILKTLDAINEQFDCIKNRKPLIAVNQKLLNELSHVGSSELEEKKQITNSGTLDDISQEKYEKLLNELHSDNTDSLNAISSNDSELEKKNEIIDNEFEQLLDELYGSGKGPSSKKASPVVNQKLLVPSKEEISESTNKILKFHTKQSNDKTVRVDTLTLDSIMNMVGELVLVRNRLSSLALHDNNEDISKAISNLGIVTADLQGAVMKTRMQPIKKVFARFPRVVRDLSRNLKKNIALEMIGENTELDKNLVEALSDPLIHLVRNSIDHGIEVPKDRITLGKVPTGKIILSASQEGDHIELSITDDGIGMDPNKLRTIAIERHLLDKVTASRLTDKECFNLIFMPGFSSKDEVSDISGRGVGMDVVKTAINALNGSINIDSKIGRGTKIIISVPLTLAILPTLIIGVAGYSFALPLTNIDEIFHLDLTCTNVVNGQLTIVVRNKSIPLFYLRSWLVPKVMPVTLNKKYGHIVIVKIGTQPVGLVVDTLIGQEEVVIKPLDSLLQGTPGVVGATIASDGNIALILDIPDLLKQYASVFQI